MNWRETGRYGRSSCTLLCALFNKVNAASQGTGNGVCMLLGHVERGMPPPPPQVRASPSTASQA